MSKFFILFILLIVTLGGFSQQYNFVNYSVEDGLIQSQVRAICQDKRGYLWLGTFGGVSQFDGINFENYSGNDGLLDNYIYSVLADSKGDVLVGSKGGFNIYSNGNWSSFEFKENLKEYYVHAIIEDQNNNYWFGLEKGWVVRYGSGKFDYYQTEKGDINNLFCDEKNNIWLSSTRGIAVVDQSFNITDSIQDVNVSQVYIENDTLCYSTFGDGVYMHYKGGQTHLTYKDGLTNNNVRGFIKSSDGNYWFYTHLGINRYRNGELKKFTKKEGLQSDNINCLIEDREGNLFMGTDGLGIIKFTSDRFVSYTKKEKDGLDNDIIMSITEDENHNMWFSSLGGGVALYGGVEIKNYNTSDGLINDVSWSSLRDNDGNLLFGTNTGISLFDGDKFNNFFYDKDNSVWSMYQDRLGNIWAGTMKGLLYFDLVNDTIINYNQIWNINKNVKSILAIDDDHLWFCSDNGIHQYSYTANNFSSFSTKDGLPDNHIMSAVRDKNEVIWIGTRNGLAYYKDGRFEQVSFSDIRGANFITFLKVDKDNNLWIGTIRGLFKLSIIRYGSFKHNNFIYYSNLDGLIGLECNQNSVFIDSRNTLWFGTSNGLMKFDLQKQENKISLPLVHLKGIRLFFEDIELLDYAESMNPNTGLPENLKFEYNQNHLTFDFIGISHSKSTQVHYQYKLEGSDKVWSPPLSNTYATYPNLNFGDHSFYVKASNDNINWTEPMRFDFTIVPPFYFTIPFFLVNFMFVGGLIWGIVIRRRKVIERKKETQMIIDQSKIIKLEHQALNASMNRHFIFNALNSIQYYINRQDKLSANRYLSSFAKLIRKNLDSSMVNEVVLEEEIERIELYLKLEQMRFKDKFTYEIQIDNNIEPHSIKIPPMLLQPFIENSIIHGVLPLSAMGHINIGILQKENSLSIVVSDNGVGIEVSTKKKLEKLNTGKKPHLSKGMRLVQERVELANKISNKKCFIDGPKQTYDEYRKVTGTSVVIEITC